MSIKEIVRRAWAQQKLFGASRAASAPLYAAFGGPPWSALNWGSKLNGAPVYKTILDCRP